MKNYTFETVPADDGTEDILLQLTDEFCKDEDWRSGDVIEWKELNDGAIQLINKSKAKRDEDLSGSV